MKQIAILIFINILIVSLYLCTQTDISIKRIVSFAGIGIVIAAALILLPRTTKYKNPLIGELSTTVENAKNDANVIAEIKKRIEAQSATVDLVAQKASETEKTLRELEEITRFSKLATAAQNDDRQAFDELLAWTDNKTSNLWELAANTAIKIRTEYNGPIQPGCMNVQWAKGIDPLKLLIEQIRTEYGKSLSLYHTDFVKKTNKNTAISKKDKMQFYIDILKKDASLAATYYAGKYFIKEANDTELKWFPFSINPLLDWWEKNKNEIK